MMFNTYEHKLFKMIMNKSFVIMLKKRWKNGKFMRCKYAKRVWYSFFWKIDKNLNDASIIWILHKELFFPDQGLWRSNSIHVKPRILNSNFTFFSVENTVLSHWATIFYRLTFRFLCIPYACHFRPLWNRGRPLLFLIGT